MPVLLDFESRSRCDLKKHGGRLYWEHPSTEALCCVLYDTDTGDVSAWLPGQPCPVRPDQVLGAHNMMGFDRFALQRLGWRSASDPTLIDTAELARKAGLPGALDALGTRWLKRPKDKKASAFTKGLSRPSRARARLGKLPDLTPDVLDRVVAYCASDVEIMAYGWPLLEEYLELDAEVSRVDRIINDRGIRLDVPLVRALLDADEENTALELQRLGKLLGHSAEELRAIVASNPQFTAITGLDNAQAGTIDAVLASRETPLNVQLYCQARRAIASITAGKLRAGLARVSPDGRLRDSHRYLGAHTWRWSSKGMQHQNFPRPHKQYEKWGDDEICMLADLVLAGAHRPNQAEIDLLLRACFLPDEGESVVVCDFSGVEARCLAWLAGDYAAIDLYREGKRDAYKVAAAQIFSTTYDEVTKEQRQAGKVSELACGFGGGEGALLNMAAGMGIDLSTASVSPDEIVRAWRALHSPCVVFWYDLESAFKLAVQGEASTAGILDNIQTIPGDDGSVAIVLPSGRPIVYNDTRMHSEQATSKRGKAYTRTSASFMGTKSGREYTYGGKLTENVDQAICRDLMADALVRAEDAGLKPFAHIHDEIVCSVPRGAEREGLEYLRALMCDLPEWAEGFPIGAEGHYGRRYRK
jgi:DNA polymerase